MGISHALIVHIVISRRRARPPRGCGGLHRAVTSPLRTRQREEDMHAMQHCSKWSAAALAAAALTAICSSATAQTFPSKNIVMIVPYTPGGSADLFSRVMGQKLGEMWGRNVVVENRPGASGMIGTEIATKAEA